MKPLVKTGLIMLVAGYVGIFLFHGNGGISALLVSAGLLTLIIGLIGNGAANKTNAEFSNGFQYFYTGGGTGIAVSTERKIVKLKDGIKIKEYSFVDMREWKISSLSGGHVSGGLHSLGYNLATNAENRKGSGLFVYVKDIDNPVWRIAMLNKSEQSRWMEILQQTINES